MPSKRACCAAERRFVNCRRMSLGDWSLGIRVTMLSVCLILLGSAYLTSRGVKNTHTNCVGAERAESLGHTASNAAVIRQKHLVGRSRLFASRNSLFVVCQIGHCGQRGDIRRRCRLTPRQSNFSALVRRHPFWSKQAPVAYSRWVRSCVSLS